MILIDKYVVKENMLQEWRPTICGKNMRTKFKIDFNQWLFHLKQLLSEFISLWKILYGELLYIVIWRKVK